MATITPFIRTSINSAKEVNVRFRLYEGRNIQLFHTSEIKVLPSLWDSRRHEIKAKVIIKDETYKTEFRNKISDRIKLIQEVYNSYTDKQYLTSKILDLEIEKSLRPVVEIKKPENFFFFEVFDSFMDSLKIGDARMNHFFVLKKALMRMEIYYQKTLSKSFRITLDDFSADTLMKFDYFLKNEHLFYEKYPEMYEKVKKCIKPKERGQNTLSTIYSRLQSFVNWALKNNKISKNPFADFITPSEKYGTPYYITIEERNKLYNYDLSFAPNFAIQRDIFVFQCLIGCRVGDLLNLKKNNIINGFVEYIARKTKEENPVTVKVPLNHIALEILKRYKDIPGDNLLPFISSQKYNIAIKNVFTLAGLKRIVTILNPTTGKEEKKQLNEIASSHIARRCFIGNLYKQVQDPNLIGSMSGHAEGSRAFARYREVDDDLKKKLVKMLE